MQSVRIVNSCPLSSLEQSVELPRALERSENDGMSEVSAGLYEVCAERPLVVP